MFRKWREVEVPTITRPIPAEEMGMRNNRTPDFAFRRYLAHRTAMLSGQTDLMSIKEIKAYREKQATAELAVASFAGKEYETTDPKLKPSLDFLKHLAPDPEHVVPSLNPEHGKLRLLLPPTLVISGYNNNFFYTNQNGYVCRRDDVKAKDVQRFFSAGAGPEDVVAVSKSMKGSNRNICNVVQNLNLKTALETAGGPSTSGVQKFIWFRGCKAAVVRCAWRPSRRDARVFVITNADPALSLQALSAMENTGGSTNLTAALRCTASTETEGSYALVEGSIYAYHEPMDIVESVAHYVEQHRKLAVRFTELVCDFIHGLDNRWWLVNVKAFRTESRGPPPPAMPRSKLVAYQAQHSTVAAELKGLKRRCRGDYCKGSMMSEAQYQLMMDVHHGPDHGHGQPGHGGHGTAGHGHGDKPAHGGAEHSAKPEDGERPKTQGGHASGHGAKGGRVSSAPPGGRTRREQKNAAAEDVPVDEEALKGATEVMYEIPFRSIVLEREERNSKPDVMWLFQTQDRRWATYGPNEGRVIESAMLAGDRSVQLNDRYVLSFDRMVQYHMHEPLKTIAVRRDPPVGSQRIPPPHRHVAVAVHDRHSTTFYGAVPVCTNCFRVYMYKDQRRMLDKTLAKDVSPFKKLLAMPPLGTGGAGSSQSGSGFASLSAGFPISPRSLAASASPTALEPNAQQLIDSQRAAWNVRRSLSSSKIVVPPMADLLLPQDA